MEIDRNSFQTSEKLRHPKASIADPCSLVLELYAMPPSRTSGGTWIQIGMMWWIQL